MYTYTLEDLKSILRSPDEFFRRDYLEAAVALLEGSTLSKRELITARNRAVNQSSANADKLQRIAKILEER